MSRATQILQQLELTHSASAAELVRLHGVGLRTIAKEVAAINSSLSGTGAIRSIEGGYRLVLVDPVAYKQRRLELEKADESYNEPEARAAQLIASLFRADGPISIEAFARETSVGRTTAIADLARAREQIAEAELRIIGRPKVGLTLEGLELHKRLYVLRHCFERAYSGETVSDAVVEIVDDFAAEFHLNAMTHDEVLRWVMVTLDRVLSGHQIAELPARYHDLGKGPAFRLAQSLASRLDSTAEVSLTDAEVIFLTLPLAGMRTPDDVSALAPPDDLESLIQAIMAAISSEMDLHIDSPELIDEFAHHLSYMLNRTRYQIWIDNSGVANIAEEFPAAHQMAKIAARVIGERVGLSASEAEITFLTAYFRVFLESNDRTTRDYLRVAIVTGTGRVSARIIQIQLSAVLPERTDYLIVPVIDAMTDQELLAPADLVVTTAEEELDCEAPVIRIENFFDRREIIRQISRLRFILPWATELVLDGEFSPLAVALDDQHFFALPAGTEYLDGVEFMARRLEAQGLVEAGFTDRVLARERQAGMRLDPWIAFPHTNLEQGNGVLLAVGVVPHANEADEGVRLIVLMGLPNDPDMGEAMLIAIYDEIIRLGADREFVAQLSNLKTYEDFFYFMDSFVNDKER